MSLHSNYYSIIQTQIPLDEATLRSIFPAYILENKGFISSEMMSEYFNIGLYSLLTGNTWKVNFSEMFKIFKIYVTLNNQVAMDQTVFLYYRTISRIIIRFKAQIELAEEFFTEERNLLLLEQLLETLPIFYSAVKMNVEIFTKESISNTARVLSSDDVCEADVVVLKNLLEDFRNLVASMRNKNANYNKINKERVSFLIENCRKNWVTNSRENTNSNISSTHSNQSNQSNSNSSNHYEPIVIANNNNNRNNVEVEVKSKSSSSSESSGPSPNSTNSNNPSKKLKKRTGNYNKTHFNRDTFVHQYLRCLQISEENIHKMLEKIAIENYKVKSQSFKASMERLDPENFKEVMRKMLKDQNVCLVGSARSGLLCDQNTPNTIDILVLPDIYNNNTRSIEDLKKCIKSLGGNLENLLKNVGEFITTYNANINSVYKFAKLQSNYEENYDNIPKDFLINFDLLNKSHPEEEMNVNLHFYKEKVKFVSDVLVKIFYKNQKLLTLHYFFQDILINKTKLLKNRKELAYLIIAYLEKNYGLFEKNNSDTDNNPKFNCMKLFQLALTQEEESDLDFYPNKNIYKNNNNKNPNNKNKNPPNNNRNKLKSPLTIENENLYTPQISQTLLENIKKVPLGLMILEFFRFTMNYFLYIKNDYNRQISINSLNTAGSCKGFEQLQENFERILHPVRVNTSSYILDHDFLRNIYCLPKIDYDMSFCKKVNALEDLYFIICSNGENSDVTYRVLLENIEYK